MNKVFKVQLEGKAVEVQEGTTLLDICKDYSDEVKNAVLAIVDSKLLELNREVTRDCVVQFLDITNKDGYRTYKRSVSMLLVKAARDVLLDQGFEDITIQYSINQGYFCDIKPKELLTVENVNKIKIRMVELVVKGMKFEKETITIGEAINIFKAQGMADKVSLLKYRRASNINVYRLDDYYDYFYGYMVPDTTALKLFDIFLYDNGIVLQFPVRKEPDKVAAFKPDRNLNKVLKKTSKWGEIMEVENVGALNNTISKGGMNDLMLVSEALMEKRIGKIADKIIEHNQPKKIVFIAGPSSSGKTTFAHRLAIQLKAHGVKPHTISVDNYFVNRELTPLDEDGNYDFETIRALDVDKFNDDMNELLEGNNVEIPEFNFISGKREYSGNFIQLKENDILVVEGIHCLNPELSSEIPKESIYKIYISALTQLNVDSHNRVPTTDSRLIRRIVRDSQYRGASAQKTISMWPSVRRGEEIHIFPYQEEADIMFNSALVYELSVLKQYVEPLLYDIPKDSEEYIEAKRLIKFLGYFLGYSSEKIPYNSLVREFIGGSSFR